MKVLESAAVAMLLSGVAAAAPPSFDIPRISRDIQILSSDAYEGRGPATAAEAKTIAYIAGQMKAAGLKPAGDKDGWYQNVPLLKSEIVGTPVLRLAAAGAPQTLIQGEQIAVRAALTGQRHVTIKDAPLVFVGYGVKAPERNGTTSKAPTCAARSWSCWSTIPISKAARATSAAG